MPSLRCFVGLYPVEADADALRAARGRFLLGKLGRREPRIDLLEKRLPFGIEELAILMPARQHARDAVLTLRRAPCGGRLGPLLELFLHARDFLSVHAGQEHHARDVGGATAEPVVLARRLDVDLLAELHEFTV